MGEIDALTSLFFKSSLSDSNDVATDPTYRMRPEIKTLDRSGKLPELRVPCLCNGKINKLPHRML